MLKFDVPLLKKISEYAADVKTFFKRLFTSFLGLTSLYLANIQLNSKFHPSRQHFLDPLLSAGSKFILEPDPLKYAGCAPACTQYYILGLSMVALCKDSPFNRRCSRIFRSRHYCISLSLLLKLPYLFLYFLF